MKIALLGYGKMGHAIETLAPTRHHSVNVVIDNLDDWSSQFDALRACDVAIDFSMPSVAVDNIMKCLSAHVPIVVGTTGWYDHMDDVRKACLAYSGSLFWASNFSIGMNILFDINRRLARLINDYTDYDVSIAETHHIHKLDAPSGTAISLANDIIARCERKHAWHLAATLTPDAATPQPVVPCPPDSIPITAVRQGEVPGIHEVVYDSPIDTISIRHSAKSRQGLALGALLAAEFLKGRTGFFTMDDLLHKD